jgi:hypothetical protein
MINKALEVSGASKLAFVGHSQVWSAMGTALQQPRSGSLIGLLGL